MFARLEAPPENLVEVFAFDVDVDVGSVAAAVAVAADEAAAVAADEAAAEAREGISPLSPAVSAMQRKLPGEGR